MHSIDLRDYADHTVKIPGKFLNRAPVSERPQKRKIVLSLWFDYAIVLVATGVFFGALQQWGTELLPSDRLHGLVKKSSLYRTSLFCAILYTYYIGSYFFNHGQTPGQLLVKLRLPMKDKCFSSALRWGLYSMVSAMSFGLFAWRMGLGHELTSHDYLYRDFVAYRDHGAPDLFERLGSEHEAVMGERRAA